MNSATCGQPLSLADIPSHRVVRLAGPTVEQLAVSLDPLPVGAPVAVRYRLPPAPPSSSVVVEEVLDQLEAMALDLFPAWLPAAEGIVTNSDFDVRVMRDIARRHASSSAHFGPFLADLAAAALRGGVPERPYPAEVRVDGLTRVIADSYGRDGLVLLVGAGDVTAGETAQRRTATAFEWLANQGGIGTWLTAGALPLVDRYPTWQPSVPAHVEALASSPLVDTLPPPAYPALQGIPHPASAVEQLLERSLTRCRWALGRTWNQTYASDSLSPPIRVDLMWPAERCVVEIDGPDHRGALKYAADRRRDNGLTVDGFAVLRFTNEEITDDPQRVLAVIESLLSTKRDDEGNLQ